MLDSLEQEKYSRQTILPVIGVAGQEKLKAARVVVIGVGALGTHTAELLARAGIGHLTIIDDDTIEPSNLQCQALFGEQDVGKKKVVVAAEKIREINSCITITGITRLIDEKSIKTIKDLKKATVIIDGTDNHAARFLLNDMSKKNKIPWIYASCSKTSGYVMPIFPEGPCLHCFLKEEEIDDTVCTLGILNTLPSIISSLQATITIKIIVGEKVNPMLLFFDGWEGRLQHLKVIRKCYACTSPSLH